MELGSIVAVIDDVIRGKVIRVEKDEITIEGEDGFPFVFSRSELVVIKENQSELSRYSDIGNEGLAGEEEKRKHPPKLRFKSDEKPEKLPPMVVDLHIEKLRSNTKGMDNFDIVNTQITEAKLKLEFAIRNRVPKVVFIHGVGAGTLKAELSFLLKRYAVESYPASFKKYGLGATEVYIIQNPGS